MKQIIIQINLSEKKCVKHGKVWTNGDDFERIGGKACEECIKNYDKNANLNS